VPGRFIVVDGVDGAGKSTLAAALAARIEAAGLPVVQVREPGGTPIAERARAILLDTRSALTPASELFLLLAARSDLVGRVIEPALADGRIVISDRFELSTMAYQVSGRRLPRATVVAANRLATGGLRPDLTLILDVPVDVSRRRRAATGKPLDRLELESVDFARRVNRFFRAAKGRRIVHLDGTLPPDRVMTEAWDVVNARLPETLSVRAG
jgi:dTMP kinase